jgi:carboxylesterase
MDLGSDWMQHPQLNGEALFWPGNSIGFLLIHGFTATTTEVRPLAIFLHELGYTVSAPLLPGHGSTPQELNKKKWTDWVMCVEEAYQQLQKTCRVVFIGGESMGGLLSLYHAKKHPEVVGILLYAPALKALQLGRAQLLSLVRDFRWKKGGDQSMPWKGYRVVPLKASRQLYKFQHIIFRLLPGIAQPTLIFQGRKDQSLDLRGPAILIKRLGSKDKTLLWFENSQHCILLDREFDQVAAASLAFIKRILETNGKTEAKI